MFSNAESACLELDALHELIAYQCQKISDLSSECKAWETKVSNIQWNNKQASFYLEEQRDHAIKERDELKTRNENQSVTIGRMRNMPEFVLAQSIAEKARELGPGDYQFSVEISVNPVRPSPENGFRFLGVALKGLVWSPRHELA